WGAVLLRLSRGRRTWTMLTSREGMAAFTENAPAKINLTLEVLGQRPDGYHEIRSVLSTISLNDTIEVRDGQGIVVTAAEEYDPLGLPQGPAEQNTVDRALGLIAALRLGNITGRSISEAEGLRRGLEEVSLTLEKAIPAAAGLGGGSSDAAAALRCLSRYLSLDLGEGQLTELAAMIGSDCPFFVRGGVQLAWGRGDLLRPLSPPRPTWFCLLKPPIVRPHKTASLFSLLREADFSRGDATRGLELRLRENPGTELRPADLSNTFDNVADLAFGNFDEYRQALFTNGALAVHLCGSGPTLYGLFSDAQGCRAAGNSLAKEGYSTWTAYAPATEVKTPTC
ncbi:MAG: 4-(cytidine 5'-diphospho)-2-C-methyl-D-erythritol kinase, partial [Dehalococcoidia bacterium]